jgi:hypothetical protein
MVASYHHGAKSYSRHFGAGANLMLLVKVTLMQVRQPLFHFCRLLLLAVSVARLSISSLLA